MGFREDVLNDSVCGLTLQSDPPTEDDDDGDAGGGSGGGSGGIALPCGMSMTGRSPVAWSF